MRGLADIAVREEPVAPGVVRQTVAPELANPDAQRPWRVGVSVRSGGEWDSNVTGEGEAEGAFSVSAGGGVKATYSKSADAGAYLSYSPKLQMYLSGPEEMRFSQDLQFGVNRAWSRWSMDFTQSYARAAGLDFDAGGAPSRHIFESSLATSVQLGPKTSLANTLRQDIRIYEEDGSDSFRWSDRVSWNHHISEKLAWGVGAGLSAGLSGSGRMSVAESLFLHTGYNPSEKWAVDASGGIQFRQGGGAEGPQGVFDIAASFAPSQGTRFFVKAFEDIRSSGADGETDRILYGFDGGVRQAFGAGLSLSLSAGYQLAVYEGGTRDGLTDRNWGIGPSLSWSVGEHLGIDLGWRLRERIGDDESGDIVSQQAEVSANWRF